MGRSYGQQKEAQSGLLPRALNALLESIEVEATARPAGTAAEHECYECRDRCDYTTHIHVPPCPTSVSTGKSARRSGRLSAPDTDTRPIPWDGSAAFPANFRLSSSSRKGIASAASGELAALPPTVDVWAPVRFADLPESLRAAPDRNDWMTVRSETGLLDAVIAATSLTLGPSSAPPTGRKPPPS